jgi:signal transduction histidine kinase
MTEARLIVLGPDGRILQLDVDSPRHWQGKRVEHAIGLPQEVVDAARTLIDEALSSPTWLGRRFVEAPSETFEIVVVEAVPLRRAPTDLRELLTRTTELLLEQARAIEVCVDVSTDPDMPSALVIDGEKIAWGIATLVGTAFRHLAMKTSKKRGTGAVRVSARYSSKKDEVSIVVQDNGPGIPKERLLGILSGTPHPGQPPALGLLVLDDVVSAHGGRLSIESSTDRVDHGTTVTLFMPAQRRQMARRVSAKRA